MSQNEFIEVEVVDKVENEIIMSSAEAKQLTEDIKSTTSALYVLLKRAHDEKAWASLGYKSWTEYIENEFDFSRARSYQLINQARVIEEIQEASGVEDLYITERDARSIKKRLPEITEKIKDEVEGFEEKEEVKRRAEEIIQGELDGMTAEESEKRDRARAADEDDYEDDVDTGSNYPAPEEEPLSNDYDEMDYGEEGEFYVVNLSRTLTIFEAMPEAENMAHIVKQSGKDAKEIKELADQAYGWLTRFLDELE